ncbi:hypothetical protein [Bifidobacterium sp. ESL0732]|uniref:hypothetical protein n=1 Tax=Bifidobacterium sp. ESL0732 TaxID=2983222 RepID=UPI0023F9CC90|nr:hypothetical protein [Bifidobacterium sp. ESL0732]WEV64408.1 hypothetical protein OZX70_02110 [Bifidobacterium sp. ESL0732]
MSGVVVLVILVILILGWLPRRTADSMKRVVEHREDKYSPSLHLVDADSGTRFSDERQPSAKGIVMQPERKDIVASPSGASVARPTKAMKERAKVAHIRKLRREAARRRAIISAALLAVTVVVFAIAFLLKFSPLFALIPAALLAIVVTLGVRTANHARAWEHDLKMKRAAQAKAHKAQHNISASSTGQSAGANAQVAVKHSATPVSGDEPPTGLMTEREIQKAMKQSRAEKERIENRRAQAQVQTDLQKSTSQSKKSRDSNPVSKQTVTAANTGAKSGNLANRSSAQRAKSQAQSQAESQSASARKSNPRASVPSTRAKKNAAKPSNNRRPVAADTSSKVNSSAKRQQVEPNDATNELKQVHPAQALDVVDLAPNQDLISFSLGAPRNGVEVKSEEPKSLEIKSTRQVAKAKADTKNVEATSSESSKQNEKAAKQVAEKSREDSSSSVSNATETEAKSGLAEGSAGVLISKKNRKRARAAAKRARMTAVERNAKATGKKATYTSDPEKFHASEVSADTEAPAVSSDSLGTGLEKILERRHV